MSFKNFADINLILKFRCTVKISFLHSFFKLNFSLTKAAIKKLIIFNK